ncbi:orotidine-5'-phosphate decarboxylase [Streptosporangium sp. NPDC001681]|uniref:orotidine-5'-phosphate decarboxylase n=1 Tax=Streptosporangium sp. NPDC001681 TaxID=3154395 RepID=UPI0033180160
MAVVPIWTDLLRNRSALCLGLAPSPKWLEAWRMPGDVGGARRMCATVLEAAGEQVAVYRIQAPFFTRFGTAGTALLRDVVDGVHERGSLAVLDAKVCDADDTMDSYADLYLGPGSVLRGDAVTANPFMGFGSLGPLLRRARDSGTLVMVLVRTSNHAAGGVQCAMTGSRTVAQRTADEVREWNDEHGVAAAAVVGAAAEEARDLVARMPSAVVELPGLGRVGRDTRDLVAVAAGAPGRAVLPVTTGVLRHGPDVAALEASITTWRKEIGAGVPAC